MRNFEYAAPRTEAEILEFLSPEPGKVEILAGGTDLIGLLKSMVVTPERVVNIMEVPSLHQIAELADGGVSIGATVKLDEVMVHPYLMPYSAIRQAISGINSAQLQCQGTFGGEICQRPQCWYFRSQRGLVSPDVAQGANHLHAILGNGGPAKFVHSSRIAPALIALNAQVRILGPSARDERLAPVADLFQTPRHAGQRETTLPANQLITHVILPPIAGRTCATYEVRDSQGPDFPPAAAAAALRMDAFGVVHDARVVMGQVAPTPWSSPEAAGLVIGKRVDAAIAEMAGAAAVARATPLSENAYKVQLAKVAVKRAILLAAGQETGGF
jgi:xanthine dehydrogenase YagS FAD-binding subunit